MLVSSSYPATPPTGWHLCCKPATHSSQPVLWLHQGVGFGTTYKQPLQVD